MNLKGCNSLQTRKKRWALAQAGLSVGQGGRVEGIGNVRVLRRTRIWRSQVPLKGKLLVVCKVAAAASENKRKK